MNMEMLYPLWILALTAAVSWRIHAVETPQSQPKTMAQSFEKAKSANDAEFMTEVIFTPGSANLSNDARSQLRDLLYSAQGKGHIGEVKVMSWADKEYPTPSKNKLDKDSRRLADDRNLEIRNYI